jgi:hypothetical protein
MTTTNPNLLEQSPEWQPRKDARFHVRNDASKPGTIRSRKQIFNIRLAMLPAK